MTRLPLIFLALMLAAAWPARGQFGNFADIPVEVNADETHFEAGIAVAERHVLIRYGAVVIYCDYAQYNPDTRDVLVLGNVRIFREGKLFTGERAIYNLETKQLTAADIKGNSQPFLFATDTLNSLGPNAYLARGITLTTSDNSKPDYHFSARTARIYPNDRVILRDVTFYLGQTPLMWFPYIHQSLNKEEGFLIFPGYSSSLGATLYSRYTFPLTNEIGATLRLDYYSKRGVGFGVNARWNGTDAANNWSRFTSYYINDASPGTNPTGVAREPINPSRYRVTFQDRTYLAEDIYSSIDINKLSDARFLQDFNRNLFRRDPNPDNSISLTKWNEDYTLTLTARESLNDFFDYTERMPDLALDVKRQPIFGQSGLFYEGETSAGYLRRNFGQISLFQDYASARADTFHQLSLPETLFGWLSVVPRAGLRGTFYTKSGGYAEKIITTHDIPDSFGNPIGFQQMVTPTLEGAGATFRGVGNVGVESSFKLSRTFEQVQSRRFGLDGLRHVIEPYLNSSFVYTTKRPSGILQFDRINPSTQLPSLDFPQFNSIDSIDNEAVVQLGARNRFETRRDNGTFIWLEWDGFFNINIKRPEYEQAFLETTQTLPLNRRFNSDASLRNKVADPGTFSNVYNTVKWTPVPWVSLTLDSQLPILDKGFYEVNTTLNMLVSRDLQMLIAHRYIDGDIYFQNSSQLILEGVYRINDNWGISVEEEYEFSTSRLQSQRYEVHRDLSSWIATLGLIVDDNGGGKSNYALEMIFTLKDLPVVRLPLTGNDATLSSLEGGSKNR